MSQKALADAAGIHANTVAKLERGEQEPAWPLVLAFAKALEVDCTAFSADGQVTAGGAADPPAKAKPAAKKGGKK